MNIKISVRDMIELACRNGDIDSRISHSFLMERAVEGTIIHQKVQKEREAEALENNQLYESEVHLKFLFPLSGHIIELQGRADGLLTTEDSITLEELKSTRKELEFVNPDILHKLQMEIYGYIFCANNGLDKINLRLTYIEVDTLNEKVFDYVKTQEELFEITKGVISEYCNFLTLQERVVTERNDTVMAVKFPFSNYRNNQRELMKSVYYAIHEQNNIFIEAPTGTGKTMSTLFPTLKTLGEGEIDRIFYVTAKTITRNVARDSLLLLEKNGLKMRSVILTAKDKICFLEESNCTPENCIFAQGHFDRVNKALFDIVENETVITKEVIELYAKKHQVCPFEFGLDVSNFCDVIVGDYNYVYNPRSKLIRYFTEGGNFAILVDEAHNLYDRACDMYTSAITTNQMEKILKACSPKGKVYKLTSSILTVLDKYLYMDNFKSIEESEYPKELINMIRGLQSLIKAEEELLQDAEVSKVYLEFMEFIKIAELYGTNHTVVVNRVYNNITLKLLCLNPAEYIKETSKMCKSTMFFSATLTPTNYFRDVYGGDSTNFYFTIPSPFDIKNTEVMINTTIRTTYQHRELYYDDIVENIHAMVDSKVGNYFVFFSSYEYLKKVSDIFKQKYGEIDIVEQSQSMTDEERDDFLNNFSENPQKTKIGFVVLGGIFGEGIDLVGDRLIGVCIVGVGLPMLTFERDLIKKNTDYDYAYTYPGFNKVMQSVGRLIRTETDRGIILLLDQRYGYTKYKGLYPETLKNARFVKGSKDIKDLCHNFWQQ